jgi:sugar lactone lactonase YvrE
VITRTLAPLAGGGGFFESPRWHEGRWWVSDFFRHVVLAIDPDGTQREILTVDGQPSGIGWLPDGSLLVVSMTDHRVIRRSPDGTITVHADVAQWCGGVLNDMVVDAKGRAFIGNFGYTPGSEPMVPANVIVVMPDGSTRVAAGDLMVPNGAVITPDGCTLIVGESMGGRYTAFTIDPDGVLTDRRLWAQLSPGPPVGPIALESREFVPDGCTMDADGCLWSADPKGRRYCRVAPGGRILEEIPAPDGLQAVACMLGGQDGCTLLLCAAPPGAHENRDKRGALLLTTTVEVPHAGRP